MKVSTFGKVLLSIICFSSFGHSMEKGTPDEKPSLKRKLIVLDSQPSDSQPRKSRRLNPSYIDFPERSETIRQLFNQAPGSDQWEPKQIWKWKIYQSARNLVNAFENSDEVRVHLTFNPYAHNDGGITYGAHAYFQKYLRQKVAFDQLKLLSILLIPRANIDYCNTAAATWKVVIEKAPKLKKVVLCFNIAKQLLPFIPKETRVDIDCEGYIDFDLSIINPHEAALENRTQMISFCQQQYPARMGYNITVLPIRGLN